MITNGAGCFVCCDDFSWFYSGCSRRLRDQTGWRPL